MLAAAMRTICSRTIRGLSLLAARLVAVVALYPTIVAGTAVALVAGRLGRTWTVTMILARAARLLPVSLTMLMTMVATLVRRTLATLAVMLVIAALARLARL